jgi:hypothetical protein
MEKSHAIILATVLPWILSQTAWAQKSQIPPQGTANYVTYYTTHSLAELEMGEAGSSALQEAVGITRNTEGKTVFDNMAVRCLFYSQMADGKLKGNGSCTEMDSDGDKVFSVFDAGTGAHTLLGGTGKYKGISGAASFTMKPLPAPGPGLGTIVVDHKVTWKFK